MDLEQKIEIPLSEYLELKEIKEHAKEVKITETINYEHRNKQYNHQGLSVSWKSDGKCWLHLSSKLANQGRVTNELVREKKELEEELRYEKSKWYKKLFSKGKEDDNV